MRVASISYLARPMPRDILDTAHTASALAHRWSIITIQHHASDSTLLPASRRPSNPPARPYASPSPIHCSDASLRDLLPAPCSINPLFVTMTPRHPICLIREAVYNFLALRCCLFHLLFSDSANSWFLFSTLRSAIDTLLSTHYTQNGAGVIDNDSPDSRSR